MTSESKILTVSYGTFSCTLEGFDNPFDTMKAIAEYFRDLAAQDRHFGAEPPPPDAAMLHRLAEREVSRLAAQKGETTARFQDADEPAVAPRIQINPATGRRVAQPTVEAEPLVDEPSATPEPSLHDAIPDGVAAKLARIRKSVHPLADASAADASAPVAFAADNATHNSPAADPAAETLDTFWSDAETAAVESAGEDTVEDAAPAAEDVAARLGALIDDGSAAADAQAGVEVDAMAKVEAEDAELSVTDIWAEAAPEPQTDADADVTLAATDAPVAEEDFDVASLADPALADSDAETELDTTLDDPDLAVYEAAALDDGGFSSEEVALLAQLDGTVFDEASLGAILDDTLPEDQPVDLSLADAALQDPLPELADIGVSTDALPEEIEDIEIALADEAAVDGVAEAVSLDDLSEEPALDAPVAPVEALADPVEEEAPQPAAKSGARTRRVNSRVVRIHPSEEAPGATRPLNDGDADEVSRLMQQAEDVMAEEENRRRQEALSRLKAAVVATEADRADVDYVAPRVDANLDPYRDDLAEAIQPEPTPEPQPEPEVKPTRRKSVMIRPADEPRPGTIRPGMISPPPLVLVSEQRVDRLAPAAAPAPMPAPLPAPEGQPMVALRTGRLSGAIGAGAAAVAAAGLPARNLVLEKPSYGTAAEAEEDEELAEDSKEIDEAGLASFAEMVGARSMAEMLEAAAAFATCIEKRSHFTRPQLMRRMMASAGGKAVSREDGLRSFGTLLRTGRIEKVTRGHYSLAENSPYLAEARRMN